MSNETVLGLDLGTNSIGWTLMEFTPHGDTCKLIAQGVRLFENAMEKNETDGSKPPKNEARRAARSIRVNSKRRAARLRETLVILQEAKLLPTEPDMATALTMIDAKALKRLRSDAKVSLRHLGHVVPYKLRTLALDEKLSNFELGRALYHLAQRRGYQSNRKTDSKPKKDDDLGKVKTGIKELEHEMVASGARTIGEHFSLRDPEEKRIRTTYTARELYKNAFDLLIGKQCELGQAKLTD